MSEFAFLGGEGRELIGVWCRNYDEAIKVMQRATQVPRKTGVSFHDEVRSLFPSTGFEDVANTCLPTADPLASSSPLQVPQALVLLRRPGGVDWHSRYDQGRLRQDL